MGLPLLVFFTLIVAPVVFGHSTAWLFFVLLVGIPALAASLPKEKPSRWDGGIWVANDEAETEKRYAAALREWEESRRWWRPAR